MFTLFNEGDDQCELKDKKSKVEALYGDFDWRVGGPAKKI